MDPELGHSVRLASGVGEHIGEPHKLFHIGEHFSQIDLWHLARNLVMADAGCTID